MRRARWLALFALAFLSAAGPVVLAPVAAAPSPPPREYQLKAVFLYNFVQFIEWPDNAFAGSAAPIRIGVLGDDPFGPALDEALAGEKVRGRPLAVKRARGVEELADCQLVFIARSEARRVPTHLAWFGERPVLTVAETESFVRLGGGIAFYSEGKKIRFEINAGDARRRGLKVSAELLSLGKVVANAPARQGGEG